MRCPDCNKMVSYDTEIEPEEVSDVEFDGNTFSAEYRRVLGCAECGTELKETTLNVEGYVEDEQKASECKDGPDHDYEVEAEATAADRMVDKDRNGKPIKNTRYMKHEYGVEVEFTARCSVCEHEIVVKADNYEAASSMDELV